MLTGSILNSLGFCVVGDFVDGFAVGKLSPPPSFDGTSSDGLSVGIVVCVGVIVGLIITDGA